MTDRDPDLQREIDRQTALLAAKIRAIAPLADPDGWARQHVEEMHADGWWPHPRSERIPEPGVPNPEGYRKGAAYARALLTQTQGERPDA